MYYSLRKEKEKLVVQCCILFSTMQIGKSSPRVPATLHKSAVKISTWGPWPTVAWTWNNISMQKKKKKKMTKKKKSQDGFLLRFFTLNITIDLWKKMITLALWREWRFSLCTSFHGSLPFSLLSYISYLVFTMFNVDACGSCKVKGALKALK